MQKEKAKKVILAAASAALAGALAIGGTIAYLTDAEVAENVFTVGNVGIELLEESFPGNDSDDVKDLVPNEEVDKDPTIQNQDVNDAFVFMTVDSPMEMVSLVQDDGTTAAQALQEIFYFKDGADTIADHANNFDSSWTRLSSKEMYVKISNDGTETEVAAADLATAYAALDEDEFIVKRYVFAYNNEIQGSSTHDGDAQTAANKVTTALFDKVQLKNFLENEIDLMTEKIQVRGYAIQADNIILADGEVASWADDKAEIYDIYITQNSAATNGNINSGNGVDGQYIEGIRNADSVTDTDNGRSETDDEHVNRWNTDDDVSGAGEHLKPVVQP